MKSSLEESHFNYQTLSMDGLGSKKNMSYNLEMLKIDFSLSVPSLSKKNQPVKNLIKSASAIFSTFLSIKTCGLGVNRKFLRKNRIIIEITKID